VTWQQAADAIDNLDDYARMMVGVDPSGPRETLYRFLEQAKAALASKVQPKGTAEPALLHLVRAHIVWLAFGECRSPGWDGPPPTAREAVDAIDAALAAPSPAPAPAELLTDERILMIGRRALDKCSGTDAQHIYIGREVERAYGQAPAVVAGDERQDIGGHIRAAANAKVAQQADDDTRRLDYLQKTQATISLVPDGRDGNGTRHAFMVGGWHCSVSRDVRASIDAAMGESQPPVQGSQP
jgi:hypothetical protein